MNVWPPYHIFMGDLIGISNTSYWLTSNKFQRKWCLVLIKLACNLMQQNKHTKHSYYNSVLAWFCAQLIFSASFGYGDFISNSDPTVNLPIFHVEWKEIGNMIHCRNSEFSSICYWENSGILWVPSVITITFSRLRI